MKKALKSVFGNEIVLEENTIFLYTIQPSEIRNALGAIIALLDEYCFTRKGNVETYKLYRTKEGNWY